MKKLTNKKTAIVLVLALAAAGLLAYGIFLRPNTNSDSSQKTTVKTTTIEDKPVGEVDYSSPTKEEQTPATDSSPTQPLPTSTPSTVPIPVTFSNLSGSPLEVRVLISEILPSGSCTLTLQKTGASDITRTAETFPTSSYTTCKGFTVDTTGMQKGTWKATVTVTSGDRTGSVTDEVSL